MGQQVVVGLINNIALLLSLGLLYDLVVNERARQNSPLSRVITGLVIGMMGVAVMLNPWRFTTGVVFDTRSVLLSVSALYFGPITALIAGAITIAYRVYEGGSGMIMGITVITVSVLIGIAWRQRRIDVLEKLKVLELLAFGMVVHVAMLLSTAALPVDIRWSVLEQIALPVLVIYPTGTVLLCLLLASRLKRKRNASALVASETRYRLLLKSLPQRIFLKDRDSVYITCNRRYAEDHSLTVDEIAGKTDFDLFPQEFAKRYREDDQRIMESGAIEEIEEKYLFAGEERVIHTVKFPVRGEEGEIVGIQGIFWDITDRLLAEEEKAKLQAQLQQAQKMESIGQLAGGIAHDFNNLLTGIKGNTSLAMMDLPASHPVYEFLSEINVASDRAANLTRQLLAFSRKQIIDPVVLDPNALLKKLDNMLGRLIGEDVEITWKLSQSAGLVRADPGQIEQVVVNLAVNSRDAMPDGGKLVIETKPVVLENGPHVVISVSDSGHGIDPKIADRIFEPFFTTKQMNEGTGLGLSTSFGIIRQHGGTIDVHSEAGKGSTFEIYLPRVDDEIEKAKLKPTLSNLPTGTEKVLIVEDDTMVLDVAIRLMENLGYEVFRAASGPQALDLMKEAEFDIDLLITDIVMPRMNGRELAQRMRNDRPDLKVLFTSGYSDDIISSHGLLDKGVHFIGKPYSRETLALKVRELLDDQTGAG